MYGKFDVDVYRIILMVGVCCVEIDVWDNFDDLFELKVIYGYILVLNVFFWEVCEVIRNFVDYKMFVGVEVVFIFLFFENYCNLNG